MTEVLPGTEAALEQVAAVLRAGGVAAIPTETVYGLAANALRTEAALKIFEAKERPQFDPLIVHVASRERVEDVADLAALTPTARRRVDQLLRAFWPGPLTVILPKRPTVPDLVTSGLGTVAVRCPAHPLARAILSRLEFPLAAPSANRFGGISPTTAQAVWNELNGRIPLILDGGPTSVGVESTVVSVGDGGEVFLYRPGGLPREKLESVLETTLRLPEPVHPDHTAPAASPGRLLRHYAPRTPLHFLDEGETPSWLAKRRVGYLAYTESETDARARFQSRFGFEPAHVALLTSKPETAAQNLFAALRALDGAGLHLILADRAPSAEGLWHAIQDRMDRAATPLTSQEFSVDLHAHLFMKQGLGWLFRGDFFAPLECRSNTDRFRSKANPASLRESGLGLVVATLYAHPLFVGSLRESIRAQIRKAEEFVAQNPEWVIARNPFEAERAFRDGKRLLILALEGASGILETEDDLKEFIDDLGVRIVTLLHFVDDRYGGAAVLGGMGSFVTPMAWLRSQFARKSPTGVRRNPRGLTSTGREFVRQLMKRRVWVDLSHCSDQTVEDLKPLLAEGHQPLLYTHTSLRRIHQSERTLSSEALSDVARTHGVVGIMPCPDMLCGGMEKFIEQYDEIAGAIGAERTVLGSDFNGGIGQLPELKTIADTGRFWQQVREKTPRAPADITVTVHAFLDAWKRLWV